METYPIETPLVNESLSDESKMFVKELPVVQLLLLK